MPGNGYSKKNKFSDQGISDAEYDVLLIEPEDIKENHVTCRDDMISDNKKPPISILRAEAN